MIKTSRNAAGYRITFINNEHNHEMLPRINIPDDVLNEINYYYNQKISPEIISIILEKKGYNIPTKVIYNYISTNQNSKIEDDIGELNHYINTKNGCVQIFTEKEKENIISAVFTQTNDEKNNLHKFGNIIFFDSTDNKLNNGWLIIPLSVITNERHIRSIGLFFTAYETNETIDFLLNCLFSDEISKNINKVIITDEDQSYKFPVSKLSHRPFHVYCAWHKRKNFNSHVNGISISIDEKDLLKNNFYKICYSTSKCKVLQAFKNLMDFKKNYNFTLYVKRLFEEKEHYSKAFLPVCTYGYNTSSSAESLNNLFKNRKIKGYMSLSEARKLYDQEMYSSMKNTEFLDLQKEIPNKFIFDSDKKIMLSKNLSKTCIIEISRNLDKTKNYKIINETENKWYIEHIAFIGKISEVTLMEDGYIQCNCGYSQIYGYPCKHLMCVISQREIFIDPLKIIDDFWFKIPNKSKGCFNFSIDEDGFKKSTSVTEYKISSNDRIILFQDKKYQQLIYLSKQICRIASVASNDVFQDVNSQLSNILSNIITYTNKEKHPMIANIPRKKGRKKKSETNEEAILKCIICDSEKHQTEDCSLFNYYSFRLKKPGPKNGCPLCHSSTHEIEYCDVKTAAEVGITDEDIFTFYGNLFPTDLYDILVSLEVIPENYEEFLKGR